MTRYELRNKKEFSMRSHVDIVCRQEGYVMGFLRYPHWTIKETPFYMKEEKFDDEYIEIKPQGGNND